MSERHELSLDEKRELVTLARTTLEEFTRSGRIPPCANCSEALNRGGAAFVTLYARGQLRGCVGTQSEAVALCETVREMTVAAASRDTRFRPVAADELAAVTIDISVLSDRQPVRGPDEIAIGVHGLCIEYRGRRGLLLPQVASERNWTAEVFLDQVCVKAGLPPQTWRSPDARLESFCAQVFGEEELAAEPGAS